MTNLIVAFYNSVNVPTMHIYRSSCKVPSFCHILIKMKFPRHIFEKYTTINFHENPSSCSRVVPCGRMDRQTEKHDEANSRFSQFCERAEMLKNFLYQIYHRQRLRACCLFITKTKHIMCSNVVSLLMVNTRYTEAGIGFEMWFNIVVVRFNIVLVRFNIVLVRFNIVLVRFNIVLVRFNIVLVRFSIVLVRFNIVLVRFNKSATSPSHEQSVMLLFRDVVVDYCEHNIFCANMRHVCNINSRSRIR